MKLTDYFRHAKAEGYAIGAFNAGDLATVKGILQAAVKNSSPVIIEFSPGESQFIGFKNIFSLIQNYRKETNLPIFINLDHSVSLKAVEEGIKSGFDLVHFDGSRVSLQENIAQTLDAVAWAHLEGVLVEAEIDKITGESRPHQESAESAQAAGVYTDPEKAAAFAQETGVDILATFIGNVHGVYKDPIKLDINRLRIIREKVPCFLSLHGGSGIDGEEIKKVIEVGKVVKINVSTEIRQAYRQTLERVINESEEVAPYKILEPVVEAVAKVVEEKILLFGSDSKAIIE